MEIILATSNAHKREELQRILHPHTVVIPADRGMEFNPVESGETYLDNAIIKAAALARHADGQAVIADDSGLSVPALGGAPGVQSARYGADSAGRNLDSRERNLLLLKNMAHLEGKGRRAVFVCCMVLWINEYRFFVAQETLEGSIAADCSGRGGFGYDPVFAVPSLGRTVAELSAAEKDEISHRGRAGARIKSVLDNLEAKK